jgi:hypothetical protein
MPLYYSTSTNAVQKTLGAQLLAGITSAVTLNNVVGIQNKPGVFVVDRVDTSNVETPAKREYISFTGTSGSTLTTLVRNVDGGGTDQDHAIGAIVEFIPDVVWAEAINTALGNIVNTTTLALDTAKVTDLTTAQVLTHKDLSSETNTFPAAATPANTGWVTIADDTSMTMNFKTGTKFMATIVPDGARTFLASNASVSQVAMLRIQYASTCSLALNILTANATISWGVASSLPVPTAIQGKADLFGFSCISTLPKFDGVVISSYIG